MFSKTTDLYGRLQYNGNKEEEVDDLFFTNVFVNKMPNEIC